MSKTKYNSGRIKDIITYLKDKYNVTNIRHLQSQIKLDALCEVLQLSPKQLDGLFVDYSPARRTLQGHAFEIVFEYLVENSGYDLISAGGDTNVDGIVNGKTLQLKTPYKKGTMGNVVSYKSHKTHGAKSEAESIEYYASNENFPDLMVGLISYSPLRILFLSKDELPTHPNDPQRILSPFYISWDNHLGLNAFSRIGIETLNMSLLPLILPEEGNELLPRTADLLQLKTDFILNTILRESNFRIWDMNVRGFAREVAFRELLKISRVVQFDPISVKTRRGDKADFALKHATSSEFTLLQMKGVSVTKCKFNGKMSLVGVETQLTRGRSNDHATQSRLYLETDFDYLIIALDPCVAQMYHIEVGQTVNSFWEFYVIPTSHLDRHHQFTHRIKSIQHIPYLELQHYKLSQDWLSLWLMDNV